MTHSGVSFMILFCTVNWIDEFDVVGLNIEVGVNKWDGAYPIPLSSISDISYVSEMGLIINCVRCRATDNIILEVGWYLRPFSWLGYRTHDVQQRFPEMLW